MTYEIELRPAAVRAVRRVAHADRRLLRAAIALLAEDPTAAECPAAHGKIGFRVRVGDHRIIYRIIYTVDEGVLLVVVVTLGHRREVYRGSWSQQTDPVASPVTVPGSTG